MVTGRSPEKWKEIYEGGCLLKLSSPLASLLFAVLLVYLHLVTCLMVLLLYLLFSPCPPLIPASSFYLWK